MSGSSMKYIKQKLFKSFWAYELWKCMNNFHVCKLFSSPYLPKIPFDSFTIMFSCVTFAS